MGKIHELVKQKNKVDVSKAIRSGESPNERDNYYNTPLHIACGASPDTEMVKILLRAKADVNVQDRNGWTPLHCSASSAQLSICELLLTVEGIDVGVLNKDGTSVLHYLVRANPQPHEIKLYRNVLKLYVEKRGDINAQSKHGEAALHQACLRGNVTAVKFLLENKAAVNILNKISETALHYAIRAGNKECVQLLLEYGIDTSIKPEIPQDSEIAALINQYQKKGPATIATPETPATSNDNDPNLPNVSELKLRIKVLRARDLTPVSAEKEMANAYCQIIFNKQKKNTKVKANTLNPSWDEVFLFDIEDLNYPIKISLYENDCNNNCLSISDKDPSKEDLLGSVSIYLKDTPIDKTGQGIPCQSSYVLKRIPRREGSRNKPKIRIELSFLLKCKLVEEIEPAPAAETLEKINENIGEGDLRTSTGVNNVGAFGRKRGKCKSKDCDCDAYQPESANGGKCQNCGHWPAQHENLGTTGAGTMTGSGGAPNTPLTNSQSIPVPNHTNSPSTNASAAAEISEITSRFHSQAASILTHNWEISSAELQFSKRLGEGTSAQVFYGTYRSQEVAIKVLKEKAEAKVAEEFAKECEIMKNLRSPHVVFFYGACLQPSMCMVLEFCHKGSLYDVLNSKEDITWKRVFKAARDTIKGLSCLHNWKPQIVHRDMKSLNLLVGDNWTVKVSDFGTSRFTEGAGVNLETLSKLRGTYAYCAPEVYFQQQFTPKSDIYSYGVILWELAYRCLTGKYEQPFGEFKQIVFDFQIIVQSAKKDVRPTIPENCPPVYSNLINRCWHKLPEDRPTTEEVADILKDMENTYNNNKADWDSRRTVLVTPN